MGDIISAFFSTPILFRALVVGILVSLCAALLGVSLVLKRYSMIGDGLSHVGFGALAIAAVMNWAPMAVAVPVVIAAAFLLLTAELVVCVGLLGVSVRRDVIPR